MSAGILDGFQTIIPTAAAVLSEKRQILRLTQQEVADRAKITLRQYQRLESGERNILTSSFGLACRVIEALDMQAFRGGIKEFGGRKVVKLLDYAPGLDGLPKSDVLKFLLEDNCSIVVRPSGTEPKLKTYISVSAENKEAAEKVEAEISKSAEAYLK